MNRTTKFAPKEFYHLYNRGTEKRDVFMSPTDYTRFITLMLICNQLDSAVKIEKKTLAELIKLKSENKGKRLIDIVSYCLMPNHFHILASEKEENGISKFMQKVMTGYTMYFNKKYERTGALFQGKFKATHVNEDRYLSYLVSYIHLNPIKLIEPEWKEIGINDLKQAEKYLDNYKYSSYQDFLGVKRSENVILNRNRLPEYFSSGFDFKKSVIELLSYPHARLDLAELG